MLLNLFTAGAIFLIWLLIPCSELKKNVGIGLSRNASANHYPLDLWKVDLYVHGFQRKRRKLVLNLPR
jgi:hypothetical protein